jgi:hypothetical protein
MAQLANQSGGDEESDYNIVEVQEKTNIIPGADNQDSNENGKEGQTEEVTAQD